MPSLSPAHNKPPDRASGKKHVLSTSNHSPSPSSSSSSYSHSHPSLTRKLTSSKGFLLSNTRLTRRRLIVLFIGSILVVFGWRTIIGSTRVTDLGHAGDHLRLPRRTGGGIIKPVWLGSTGPKGRDGNVGGTGASVLGGGGGRLIVAGFEDEGLVKSSSLKDDEEETDDYAEEKRRKGGGRAPPSSEGHDHDDDDDAHDPPPNARHPHANPPEPNPDRQPHHPDLVHNIQGGGQWKMKPRIPQQQPGVGQKKHPSQLYRPRNGSGEGGRFGPARMDSQDEDDEHQREQEQDVKVEERGYDSEEQALESEEDDGAKRSSRHQPREGLYRRVQGRGRYQQRPNIVDDPEWSEKKEHRDEDDSAFKGWDEEEVEVVSPNGLSRLGEDRELSDEVETKLDDRSEDELVERDQMVMEGNDDEDERTSPADTNVTDDDLGMFHWADGTGLSILTEEDLYGTKRDTDDAEEDPSRTDDVETTQYHPDDHEDMTPEQEWQAHLDRVQKMKEKNRIENRRPIGFQSDDHREFDGDQQLEEEEEMDDGSQWIEEWGDEGECEFMSVVDAYQTALTRLRKSKSKLAQSTDTGSEYDSQTDPDELTEADYARFSHPDLASHIPPKTPGAHRFSRTGHLVLSEDEENAEHPIPQLLKLGERRWQEMVGRQSKTLSEAVDEYKRRYGRQPPRGFDIWWDFAVKNSLLLPDEYDRIHLDLAPFWALPRAEMRRRVREAMDLKETFVLVVENGTVSVEVLDQGGLDWGGTLPRAKDAASLIRPFSQYMPDMRAVFSIHDQPQIYLSATRRASLVELGLRGEHTSHLRESDSSEIRWERSCSRESNLRTPTKHEIDEAGSLVYDTQEAADICKNPYLMDLHGFTVEKRGPASHPKPRTSLIPLFGLAKTSINSDILVTPLDQFADAPGFDPPWKYKRSDRIAWRGSSTGISWMDKDTPWRKSHRFRLHDFAGNRSMEEVSFVVPDLGAEGGPLKIRRETGITRDLSEFFYDMKLAGEPLQCDERDGTCDEMNSAIAFAEHQPAEDLNDYKFLFDIDGNSWSGRFRRLMNTKSLVLKTGIFTEWFQPHLIPWFSYIPTRLDFSDLPVIMSFLRGSPEAPNDGFDEVAEAIASNGRCFTKKVFRVEDMQAYMFRLFLEYARLMAPTDENVDFIYDGPVADTDGTK